MVNSTWRRALAAGQSVTLLMVDGLARAIEEAWISFAYPIVQQSSSGMPLRGEVPSQTGPFQVSAYNTFVNNPLT